MKISDRVEYAADIISDPQRWTRGIYEDSAGRFCAIGALRTAFGLPTYSLSRAEFSKVSQTDDYIKVFELVHRVVARTHERESLTSINDGEGRLAALTVLRNTVDILRRWGF